MRTPEVVGWRSIRVMAPRSTCAVRQPGCLLVRDGEQLRRAHAAAADYLQDFDAMDRADEPPSPAEYGPELSRDYRGLRVWLPLMLHGARAFREALAEKLALARRLYTALQALIAAGAPLEIVAAPQLTRRYAVNLGEAIGSQQLLYSILYSAPD